MQHATKIKNLLKSHANPDTAANYERYFKHVIRFHGLKAPQLRNLFKTYYKDHLKQLPADQQQDIALTLIQSKYSEEKRFATLLLEKHIKTFTPQQIAAFEPIIEKHVYDWGTCDGLTGSVIGKAIRHNPPLAKSVYPWRKSNNLWVQRGCCVAFVPTARSGQHNDQIINICKVTIKNPERFTQLGTGWVLRELSLADLDRVVDFIKTNYTKFSREGLRYAIEKMQPDLRQQLLSYSP